VDNKELITILADGEFHSGEEIGAVLGISRAAVWKQLQKLDALDLTIESVKGRGYRLSGGLDLLDAAIIRDLLPANVAAMLGDFEVFPVIDSTNNAAAKAILAQRGSGYCCFAELQTAGRGRRGRQWQSPFGRNIYLSMVWEFQSGAAALEGLSLSIGLAVVRSLQILGVNGAGVKWPNDVLYDGKKLAGILLEMQGDPSGLCQVVVGLGLNVNLSRSDTAAIDQPWIDLFSIVGEVNRNQLAAILIEQLYQVLAEFSAEGFTRLREEWSRYDVFANKAVKVQLGETYVEGLAGGVDGTGGLVLQTAAGQQVFHGGEVSLRGI
jgi:BirA family biotin operon repressor/biotin-[acetyl-CoA-carboxylase] ligase